MKPLILLILCFFFHSNTLFAQLFTKISGQPVVMDDRYSEGASWGDIDNDGDLDLFVPDLYDNRKNILFINNGDGTFTERSNGPVVTDVSTSAGGNFGDFDNDGDLDLFVVNYFGDNSFLYLNNGTGAFTKVTTGTIVNDGGWSFGSSVADYNNDGFLDVFVTNIGAIGNGENNFLYRNNGDGTFTKITTGAIVTDGGISASSSWCDYDNDGDVDLFVPNGGTFTPVNAAHFFYQNNGDGTFTRLNTATIGIANSWGGNGSWADFDNDGDFDLFVTNFGGDNNMLYRNNGNGTFTRITTGIIVNDGGDSVSSTFGDFDNDGDLDVYVTNDFNEDNVLYKNNGDGTFTKITIGDPVSDSGRSNGATWADYNNDGFLDLFVPNGQRPITQSNILYRNNGNSNHWINISCQGIASNRTAIGTRVRAKAVINGATVWQLRQISGETGFNAQNSFNVEFGFADATIIDSLIFEWPAGGMDTYTNVVADGFYEAIEGVGLNPLVTSIQNLPAVHKTFELFQNYPNPFNPSTTISYSLPKRGGVTLTIYNLFGQEIKSLINEEQSPGLKSVVWDGRDNDRKKVSSGIYFYRLKAGNIVKSRKLLLAK